MAFRGFLNVVVASLRKAGPRRHGNLSPTAVGVKPGRGMGYAGMFMVWPLSRSYYCLNLVEIVDILSRPNSVCTLAAAR